MSDIITVIAKVDDADVITIRGRAAWALLELMAAGDTGCSYIDNAAPRWSGYIHQLCKIGVVIDTTREAHDGPFAGHHARYFLQSRISLLAR